jgi:hypothetical protein
VDPDIRRVKTLFQIGHKPTKRKTSLESEGVHKYLRDWDKFTLKDDILYRYSNLYSEKVSQLILPPTVSIHGLLAEITQAEHTAFIAS